MVALSLGFCRWFLYIIFAFLLGAICNREALRSDFLIAEKVGASCAAQRDYLFHEHPTPNNLLL